MYSTEDALAILIAKSDMMVVSLRELVVETKRHNAEMERLTAGKLESGYAEDAATQLNQTQQRTEPRYSNHLDVTARHYGLVRHSGESNAELLKRIDLYKLLNNT